MENSKTKFAVKVLKLIEEKRYNSMLMSREDQEQIIRRLTELELNLSASIKKHQKTMYRIMKKYSLHEF